MATLGKVKYCEGIGLRKLVYQAHESLGAFTREKLLRSETSLTRSSIAIATGKQQPSSSNYSKFVFKWTFEYRQSVPAPSLTCLDQ